MKEKRVSEIAKAIGCHKSTISRELKRNSSPEYKLYLSHRSTPSGRPAENQSQLSFTAKTIPPGNTYKKRLMMGWSPEIIAGRIKKDHPGLSISHEAVSPDIYHPQTLNRHELINCLRRSSSQAQTPYTKAWAEKGEKSEKPKIPNN